LSVTIIKANYPMLEKIFPFYFIVSPGLEDLALNECTTKWPEFFPEEPLPLFNKTFGGFEAEMPMEKGLLLNQILKIPTRILLRFADFKCRDLPKLFKKIKNLDWSPFLSGHLPQIKVSAHQSRLFHTQKIEKTIEEALQTYFKAKPPKKKYFETAKERPPITLFFRFAEDTCTISLDTSGDPLYKRSYRPFIGKAPLRENLGAALCFSLKKTLEKVFPQENQFHLIDPMCGSGTFLLEGKYWSRPNQNRSFSYLAFPLFQSSPPKLIDPKNQTEELFQSFQGYDQDSNVIKGTKENGLPIDETISLKTHDFLSEEKLEDLPSSGVVLINPPYGKRIPLGKKPQVYYKNLFEKIKMKISPKAFGILLPKDQLSFLKKTDPYILKEKKTFKNGGIPVDFLIFCKRPSLH